MPSDGLGMQTTISQSGTVARTQVKGQPAQQPAAPFSEKVDPGRDTHVERARPTEKADRGRVDPDDDKERRRHRRHRPRQEDGPAPEQAETAPPGEPGQAAGVGAEAETTPEAETPPEAETIGRHVDCRA